MLAILKYLHTCFLRSYRYVPSVIIFLGGICLVYSVIPNPIMSSYAFSTSFLFIISVMLCYRFIDIESMNQEAITLLHTGSIVKLSSVKLLYIWLFTIPLAIFAVVYPALFDRFNSIPSFSQLIFAFICHIVGSLLAITVSCWFSTKYIDSRLKSFLLISLLVVVTLAVPGIEQQLPDMLKVLIYVIPPLASIIDVMMNDEATLTLQSWIPLVYNLIYCIILFFIYLFVINKGR